MCRVLLDTIDVCTFPQIDLPLSWLWATYLIEVSKRTISWLLVRIDGNSLHLSMYDGWEENIRSSVLLFLVGKSTSCSRLFSRTMSRVALFTLDGYWLPSLEVSDQLISGKLKSPHTTNMLFLHCLIRFEISLFEVVEYISSVLFGGL